METTMKLKLLKRHNKMNPGDVIRVRPGDARVLKAIGVAEDYIEPAAPRTARTATRVMQSETGEATSDNAGSESSLAVEDETGSSGFGRQPYSRRDMQPEE